MLNVFMEVESTSRDEISKKNRKVFIVYDNLKFESHVPRLLQAQYFKYGVCDCISGFFGS